MGLREAYEQGVAATASDGCGICQWLPTLPAEDREFADKILWEMLTPTRFRFSAEAAEPLLQAGDCPVGRNVIGSHRRGLHGRAS